MSAQKEKKIDVCNRTQLKAWLAKNALTHAWLAQQVGTSRDNVSQWVCKNGKIPPYFVQRVEDVIAKYDLTMEALAEPSDIKQLPLQVIPQKTKEEKEAFIAERIKGCEQDRSVNIFVVNSADKLFRIQLFDMRGSLDNPRESLDGHHSTLLTFPVPGLEDLGDREWEVADGFNLYNAREDTNYAIIPLKYAYNPRNNATILQPISQSYKWWKEHPDGTWSFWYDVAGFIFTNKYHWAEVVNKPMEEWDQKKVLKELEDEIEAYNLYLSGEQYCIHAWSWHPLHPWKASDEATNISYFADSVGKSASRKVYERKDAWKLYDEISAVVADDNWHVYNPETDSPDKLVAAMNVHAQNCPVCGTTNGISGYILDDDIYYHGECRKCGTVLRIEKKNIKGMKSIAAPPKKKKQQPKEKDTQRASVALGRRFAKIMHSNNLPDKVAADFFGVSCYSISYWRLHTFPKFRKDKLREFEKLYESENTGRDKGVGK